MSKFYVGQRVRILWSRNWPELAGHEGKIVDVSPTSGRQGISEWWVAPDCWGTHVAPRAGLTGAWVFGPHSSQLASAYDGNEKVSWSECLWQPTPERVT